MVVLISDKTQNYSKVTKLLVKPIENYKILNNKHNKKKSHFITITEFLLIIKTNLGSVDQCPYDTSPLN